ncbi:MAG: hypothetical protein QM612_02525 [Thermomonas sp.]|uniref:hypothetical protein n=1 Tax=Thermomonas sp. TaxID=1971895 RepID=UPI0039E244B7
MEQHSVRLWFTDAPEKGAVWLLVALLHLLGVWVLMRPRPEADGTAPSMTLVYIDLPPPVKHAPVEAHQSDPARSQTRPSRTHANAATPQNPGDADATTPTLTIIDADDSWEPQAASSKDDGIRFERKSPMVSHNPIRRGPPERFRMRGPGSLADVVRKLSQALLWPAGYSDNPCDGLAEAARVLSANASTKGRQALLEDVVRQQSQYCP